MKTGAGMHGTGGFGWPHWPLLALPTSAERPYTVFPANCLVSLTPLGTSTFTYHWNTGQSSTVTFNNTTVVRAANGTSEVTSTGAVTAGLGQGSAVVKVVVLPQPSLTACATTGVESLTGPATLSILP